MADTGWKAAASHSSVGWSSGFTATNLSTSNNVKAQALGTTYLSGLLSNFSFGVPTGATIDGIEVQAEFSGDVFGLAYVRLSLSGNGGAAWTATKEDSVSGTTDTTKTYGGALDIWGGTWPVSSFDASEFFMKVEGKADNGFRRCYLDYVAVKVHYTLSNGNFFAFF